MNTHNGQPKPTLPPGEKHVVGREEEEEELDDSLRSFSNEDGNAEAEEAARPRSQKMINEVIFRTSSSYSLTEEVDNNDASSPSTSKTASMISSTISPTNQASRDPNDASDIEAQASSSIQTANNINDMAHQGHATRWPDHRLIYQLPCVDAGYLRRVRLWYKRKVQPFWKITVAQILCVIYILVLTFSPVPVGMKDPATNDIIDSTSVENTNNGVIYVNGSYRPVVAIGGLQKFCLAISRMSAFSMYPMLVVVFVTKMKGIQTFLSKTPLSMYLGMIKEGHDFHAHAGKYIAFDVWLHTLFHILRWASAGNINLLWESNAGITGLITVLATPLITFPMIYFKRKISYEIRKALHYLFYLFAVAMCFHVPLSAIPNGGFIAPILGSCIVLYTLDTCYVYMFMCEKIETTAFHVLSSGVRISMPVSERFQRQAGRAGYAYINIPWIDDKQWHPFSLFEDPDCPSTQQMFLMKCGNWTNAVHTALSRDTTRPCWIKEPFPSPYSHAALYDNMILVASGIGITPALAAISAFKSTRRVNLIWAVRDPEMLEFFLEHMYLEHDGWNLIFYTGKKPLNSAIEGANSNVRIIKGRPKLSSVIPNVIYGIESKEGLPEKYTERSKDEVKKLLTERMRMLELDPSVRATDKVDNLRDYGEALGFSLHMLIEEIQSSCAMKSFSEYDPQSSGAEKDANNIMKQLKSSTLMDSFSEYDPKSSSAEKDATNLLNNLKSSMIYARKHSSQPAEVALINGLKSSLKLKSSMRYSRKNTTQSADVSLRSLLETDEDIWESPTRRPSMKQWATVRKVVDERDSTVLAPTFRPWKENEPQERCVKRLDDQIMSTWGISYCGGSKPVIAALSEISIDYNIDLHIDSFAW